MATIENCEDDVKNDNLRPLSEDTETKEPIHATAVQPETTENNLSENSGEASEPTSATLSSGTDDSPDAEMKSASDSSDEKSSKLEDMDTTEEPSAEDNAHTHNSLTDQDDLVDAKIDVDDELGAAVPAPAQASPSPSASSSTKQTVIPPECQPSTSGHSQPNVYHVKWVTFRGNKVATITQNENGPCPLLAIMNVLLLQTKVKLPATLEMISDDQLMQHLADCIFANTPKDISEGAQLNYEQNMNDAMAVFHKLQTGLDVNVKFTGVSDFEYTSECIVFDLLGIPLYHGWLVDPQTPEVCVAVGNCSYNQLVEKIISQKNDQKEELQTEALIAEEFLNRSASQLTYHGLSELSVTIKEGQLAVLFRNNHFSTVYKHKNELFVLVTDQGFLQESNVIWETLSNVEGDGHFVDAEFKTYRKPESAIPAASPAASTSTAQSTVVPGLEPVVPGTSEQIDQDYLVALSLQQEQQETNTPTNTSSLDPQGSQPTRPGHDLSRLSQSQTQPPIDPYALTDHELALRLQQEEDEYAASLEHQQQQRDHSDPARHARPPGVATPTAPGATPPPGAGGKSDGCVIL